MRDAAKATKKHTKKDIANALRQILGSRACKWPLLALTIVSGMAFAFDYRVDTAGGPESLKTRIGEAYARWREVTGSEVAARETDDAPNVIRYGEGPTFGPDILSLTVRRLPEATTEVLLNPTEPNDRALTHELGLLAGLAETPLTRSIMNPAIEQEATADLSPADEAALRALQTFAPEDVNQDGAVDFYDLADIGTAFGETGISLLEDIDDSGLVDRADLERLRAAYTFGAPAETAEGIPGALPESGGAGSGGSLSGGAGSGGIGSGGTLSGGG